MIKKQVVRITCPRTIVIVIVLKIKISRKSEGYRIVIGVSKCIICCDIFKGIVRATQKKSITIYIGAYGNTDEPHLNIGLREYRRRNTDE
jgi:hypothetical protein